MSASQSSTGERTYLKLYYDVLEEVQPLLPPAEFSVFIAIYREIVGYERLNRTQAPISFPMLEQKTGISQRQLKRLIKSLLKKGYIILCETVGRWGTHVYSLAKRFLTGDKESSSDNMTLVQRPLPGSGDNMTRLVVTKRHDYPGQIDTTSSAILSPEPTAQPAPEQAPDEPKEILKKEKENIKERSAEKAQEEEEEEEEDYEPSAPEWQTVLEKLKPQVSPGAYGSWFRSSRAFKREDQFIIQVESSFHKRHMQRFAGLIRSILVPMLPPSMDVFIATAEELRAPALAVAVGV